MNQHVVFRMGEFPARFPCDRLYARQHLWALEQGPGVLRFGFSAYAMRLMLEVSFLDWRVEAGDSLQAGQEIGALESKKAASSLYAPLAGRLLRLHEDVLEDPSMIHRDPYGQGWLLEMEASPAGLLSPEEYLAHLEAVWPATQRALRGQLRG